MKELFKRIFGSSNQRLLNQYSKIVDQINALEDEIASLNDSDLLKIRVITLGASYNFYVGLIEVNNAGKELKKASKSIRK